MIKSRKQLYWLIPLLLLLLIISLPLSLRLQRPDRKSYKTQLFDGVTYAREVRATPRPLLIHTVAIDLSLALVDFLVTPGDDDLDLDIAASTTSSFLEKYGLQLAINGSFFVPFKAETPWDYYPHRGDRVDVEGLAISNGRQYSDADPNFPVLCFVHGQILIESSGCPAETTQALAGNHILVQNGRLVADEQDLTLHPRTAVALSPGGQMLWFIVIDGRQPAYSEGVTLAELADIILALGANDALNLDGGGSSTLVTASSSGPLVLNAPIHTAIPMRQRPVANHLGVFIVGR
jgi:hypothetical protein